MNKENVSVIHFTKMHGLGNDFVIIHSLSQTLALTASTISHLANRHTGIGFDQLLLIESANHADFFCRIFNADGSEAEQCGNGLRCVARYIYEQGLYAAKKFQIATKAGVFPVQINDDNQVCVTINTPLLEKNNIELALTNNHTVSMSVLSLGNPHAIIKVDDINTVAIHQLGAHISSHTFFEHGANVGFMQIINPHHVLLRTFERGVGETFACGSNACAAALTGIINGWLQAPISVEFIHGHLLIEWDDEKKSIYMTGPATFVFTGKINI